MDLQGFFFAGVPRPTLPQARRAQSSAAKPSRSAHRIVARCKSRKRPESSMHPISSRSPSGTHSKRNSSASITAVCSVSNRPWCRQGGRRAGSKILPGPPEKRPNPARRKRALPGNLPAPPPPAEMNSCERLHLLLHPRTVPKLSCLPCKPSENSEVRRRWLTWLHWRG